ncbi:MAG: hypothetical protein VB010_00600 [Sphaerochaeta associata]|uniref:hypothetical protein n=1 Tax=Sphaerochaeta associata TaxID=1129264 RepID=UPI002B1FF370|nr:hypothetical protein [Sphaerochaeta associata]MEA5105836.1 hypothetical protein [Sphaerochaeta associata]
MKRINLVRTISLVLLLSTLFLGCATPIDQQAVPPVPAAPVEVEQQSEAVAVEEPKLAMASIELPPRFIKYPPVVRYGEIMGLVNETGYSIKSFDLFNDRMYLASMQVTNLLPESLGDGERMVIDLTKFPLLSEEIQKRDGSIFTFNASDWDDDLYWGEWDPSEDSWNLVLTSDSLLPTSMDIDVESFGPSIVIANRSGYPFERLYIERKSPNEMDGSETNLLGEQLLSSGQFARIQVADLAHLQEFLTFDAYATLTITAFDTDGDRYTLLWHPTTDAWFIELTLAELQWPEGDQFYLTVQNQTGQTLWYLYAVPDSYFVEGDYGSDLLDWDLIYDSDELTVDLAQLDYLDEALQGDSDEVIHIIARDDNGVLYHKKYYPNRDIAYVVFEAEAVLEEAESLSLYNDTPADLWFLYLATDEMVHEKNFGNDLLRDGIWEMKEAFTFKVSPALVEDNQVLHLYAYDYLDNEYHKEWKVSDGWTLTFNADDLSTQ